MDLLVHKEFDLEDFQERFPKILGFLRERNFAPLDVKKFQNSGFYRVKLDYQARLLFRFGKYNGNIYLLLLELIEHHNYAGSRFLRTQNFDDSHLIPVKPETLTEPEHSIPLQYVNPRNPVFHLLDKVISFDDDQEAVFQLTPPLILIGSAGSGKTALMLEKFKTLKGRMLYVTLSPHLVQNSGHLFYTNHAENETQDVDFLSYGEFLETLQVPEGRELTFRDFENWFYRHKNFTVIKDAHKLFEEFRGVLTGGLIDKEWMGREEYLSLGVKQSVFLGKEREDAWDVFEKYLQFLGENHFYDLNIISHRWLEHARKEYDFVVVDEVQDITNMQLHLILSCLKKPGNFMLCGDSNQIVHPNFFSWSKVKSLLSQHHLTGKSVQILASNYRNSAQVTQLANLLLKIKNARFGSIDRESSFLVKSVSGNTGEAVLLEYSPARVSEINDRTRTSANFAVIVMRPEDKQAARKIFQTPLIFSVHESKGLEYENVIMYNFVSSCDKEFREISRGVDMADLEGDEMTYARSGDKTDKSLEVYKFFINSFYVAITRSLRNVYLIESSTRHDIFKLLQLADSTEKLKIQQQVSTEKEWRKEAARLDAQGKAEQADAIRQSILTQSKPVTWVPLTYGNLDELKKEAYSPDAFNRKAKDKMYDFAIIFRDFTIFRKLLDLKYSRSDEYEQHVNALMRRRYPAYHTDNLTAALKEVESYGINFRDAFNLTPLMVAVFGGATRIATALVEYGADLNLADNIGRTALQMALYQCYKARSFYLARLNAMYSLLAPPFLKVRVDQKLIKIDSQETDFLIVNLLIAIQNTVMSEVRTYKDPRGITVDDIEKYIPGLSETIIPGFRRQRAYLNAHFANHEVSREKGSRKLYLRVERGYYVLNPDMEISVAGEWIKVSDLLKLERADKEATLNQLTNFLSRLKFNEKTKKFTGLPESQQKSVFMLFAETEKLRKELDV